MKLSEFITVDITLDQFLAQKRAYLDAFEKKAREIVAKQSLPRAEFTAFEWQCYFKEIIPDE